jgi:uncharacterized protein YbaR (Trm112 family)
VPLEGARTPIGRSPAMLDKDLLDILACPLCKSAVRLEGDRLLCGNADCGCRYRVEEDIPIMLVEEAERPCPGCGAQRDWDPDHDALNCPKCARRFVGFRPE